MIFQGECFLYSGRTFLLLHCESKTDRAWAIDIHARTGWPREFRWSEISKLPSQVPQAEAELPLGEGEDGEQSSSMALLDTLNPTPSMEKVRDRAFELLGTLIDVESSYPQIFDKDERGTMIAARAAAAGCSDVVLYKQLRRYWLGGQKKSALLGKFHRCGRAEIGVTAARGAKPEFKRPIYQLTERDFVRFREVIVTVYLKGELSSKAATFQRLLEKHYINIDGNGEIHILPEGERPTIRQFQYFLKREYPTEIQLRSRKGDKDFERDNRSTVGTVMDICNGVGDIFEVDATIADIYLVAEDNIKHIIGKPTLFLIIDRKSRLIVGWYVGLENASWMVAVEAFISISADKQEICSRLGVKFDPKEWPAQGVFPKKVLADRGEMMNFASTQLSDNLGVAVANLPAQRPDWKPVVESNFKQFRMIIQPDAPGFDPPENAKKRQGKHYDKDACMTLRAFEKTLLEGIIFHNRKPIIDYKRTPEEKANGVRPIPLELWAHDIEKRSGELPRFAEQTVRMALLPRDNATISEEGIGFRGCLYTCKEAMSNGWYVNARIKRFKLQIAFDRRLVDRIYVFDPNGSGQFYECRLTTRSEQYQGMSFSEVDAIEKKERREKTSWRQTIAQEAAKYHAATDLIFKDARQALKDAKLGASRAARRADTKPARIQELRQERLDRVHDATPASVAPGKLLSMVDTREKMQLSIDDSSNSQQKLIPDAPMMAEEQLKQMRERMFRG